MALKPRCLRSGFDRVGEGPVRRRPPALIMGGGRVRGKRRTMADTRGGCSLNADGEKECPVGGCLWERPGDAETGGEHADFLSGVYTARRA